MTPAYATTRTNWAPHLSTGYPQHSQPAELLKAFSEAKNERDLKRMHEICQALERGWSEVPVWQRGYNKISYQRQRLSPYVRFRPSRQELYYQAYMQAVLDPEFRQLLSEEAHA